VAKLKKLIIHPGFHKTGTTALQQALSEVRGELRACGFSYPKVAGNAHHRAAWSVIEKTWGWRKRGGRLMAPIEWQKLERKITSSKNVSVISSEFFSQASNEQLANLARKINLTPLARLLTNTRKVRRRQLPSSFSRISLGRASSFRRQGHHI
jgi:hypothetical protein